MAAYRDRRRGRADRAGRTQIGRCLSETESRWGKTPDFSGGTPHGKRRFPGGENPTTAIVEKPSLLSIYRVRRRKPTRAEPSSVSPLSPQQCRDRRRRLIDITGRVVGYMASGRSTTWRMKPPMITAAVDGNPGSHPHSNRPNWQAGDDDADELLHQKIA